MDYWYCGNSLLQPVAVSDDGVHTRLRFGPSAELPAIFVRSDDGTESLLNYSMEGRDMVIHRLARHFILRRGKLVGCVTNKGFIGSGERLESGTVSPQVHRQTRQCRPMSFWRREPSEPSASAPPDAAGEPPADETPTRWRVGGCSGRAGHSLLEPRPLGPIAREFRSRGNAHGDSRCGTHDLVLLGRHRSKCPRAAPRRSCGETPGARRYDASLPRGHSTAADP